MSEYESQKDIKYDGIPFTNLYQVHPLVSAENLAAFWDRPPFPVTEEQKHYYKEALNSIETNRESLLSLPRQLVHHDLLVFNLLSVDRSITGVLDFDLLAVDISFLEFVISLNHVLQLSSGSLEMAAAFIEGFTLFPTFSSEEIRQLRTLTQLYHIALHIYVGQYVREKTIQPLLSTLRINLLSGISGWSKMKCC
ncbi:phosphotransferase [Paenibacillus sp. R14(2021)]|uniref:phosphotransferase n=1 Tax=Paenibacillus sp. R14(2021) TaxID=2859228 RepID=UPI001C614E49|nr:phosphotransferase [Paenibacillus sp. R14(2021)]